MRLTRLMTLIVVLLILLTACVAVPPATQAPADLPPTPTPAPVATEQATPPLSAAPIDPLTYCPTASETLQRLVVAEHGYCLAYPAEYKVEKPNADETILLIGGLLNASDPRVHIRVTDAAGVTAETAADRVVADFKDFTLDRSARMVTGEAAVVLDKVPGQEINRRVLFVHGDRLYDLMFMPADPAVGAAFTGMNALFDQVLESFTFLPEGFAITDDCLTPTSQTLLHRDPARGYCLLYPAGYSVQQTDANEAIFYSGSLMDASKPKLFVRVEDANGQTAKEIADTLAAEVQTNVPGQQIDRPFGVTFGYEVAERLDNMPGQDLGRVVVSVHGPRAYRLAFVPMDPNDAAMVGQTEALYDLVLRSFRFTD